jgi:hypothetical protein
MEANWSLGQETPTYVYALFGGVVGMVAVTAHNLVAGAESQYSLWGVFVGSGLAGFLAANGSRRAKRAGIGAGLLGVVPAFVWLSDFLPGWVRTSASEGGPVLAVIFFTFVVLAVATIATLIGVFGGSFGGWLAEMTAPETGG